MVVHPILARYRERNRCASCHQIVAVLRDKQEISIKDITTHIINNAGCTVVRVLTNFTVAACDRLSLVVMVFGNHIQSDRNNTKNILTKQNQSIKLVCLSVCLSRLSYRLQHKSRVHLGKTHIASVLLQSRQADRYSDRNRWHQSYLAN